MSERLHSSLGGVRQKSEMTTRADEKATRAAAKETNWRKVCKQVNERDGYRCRCCGVRGNPNGTTLLERLHHHHVTYRSAGGTDSTAGVCLLCAACHDAVHAKKVLAIDGNADQALTFARRDEHHQWVIWRQETMVRMFERD